jgi:8-amino-3,8-dideoxy-alpha-D-manno-octulosonate transaminase
MGAEKLAIDGGTPVRSGPLLMGKGLSLLGDEERNAALEVLASRSLFRYYGPDLQQKVAAFEALASEQLGCAHAVAVSSGTAALRVALAAAGVGCGDEVIVPAFTFIATVNAVVVAGAVPIFAEVDDTLGLDAVDVASKITERTAAVIPVHLENTACDLDPLMAVTTGRGLTVIEDAAQAMGASYHGRPLGSIGDLGCFSLQLDKNVTSGEGGLVTTSDDRLYMRAARYQDQGGQFITSHGGGRGDELDEAFVGENLRMTEVAGAIAVEQLRKLPGLIEGMRTNRDRVLKGVGEIEGLQPRRSPDPAGDGGSSITWFLPTPEKAKRFVSALLAEGVPAGRFYGGKPVYLTPSIVEKRTVTNKGGPWHCAEHPTDVSYHQGLCPRTEDLASRNVIVPIGAGYSPEDCDDIAEAITKVASVVVAE